MTHQEQIGQEEASEYFAMQEYFERPRDVKCLMCGGQLNGTQDELERIGWLLNRNGEFCPKDAMYGKDIHELGFDLVYQYGRYAKTLESVIEAQEDFLRLTNGSKETSSVASGTVPALAS